MVKCECGATLTENDKRCPKCGKPVSKKSNNKIITIVAIIVVIAIVGVLASGMLFNNTPSTNDASSNTQSIEPTNNTNAVDNSDSNTNSVSSEYWASAKAEKFHLPTCEWAQKIKDSNKIVYQSREDAIADGKVPCSVCNP
ncbi:zinc ribbon domain-containing protein [Methanobrevibacter sp.]|uniref:zinc ribbon domain-containing protein n=1 Tax=Methanobrevibacter sp. TaxID=66852 RepID=UPI0025F9920F|nr:zinc ribbon domain-containing protein [uncultured Methanobrevibacter sp.]